MKIANEYDISEKEIKSSDKLLNKQYTGVKVKQRSYTNNDYCVIENKNNNYVVMRLRTTSKGTLKWLPLVFDLDNFEFIKNFDVEGETVNWNLANNYVTFSRKNGTTMFYLHNLIINVNPDGSGKEFCDHLNSITLDNRKDNLVMKTQSKQNNNQKTRKCASKSLYKMPEPYKTYFLENRPKFIYWLYDKSHGHRIVAGPVENIKEKKFSSKDPSQIPYLMKKAEDYLIDMAKQNNMSIDQITSDLEPKAHQLKREYRQIVLKESKILELNLPFYSRSL
jgi:hypothetical protein